MRLTSQQPVEYEYPVDQVTESLQHVTSLVNKNAIKPTTQLVRKSRRNLRRWYRAQYFVTTAAKDLRAATKRNEDIFAAILLFSCVIGYGYAVAASQIFITFFLTGFTLAELSGANVLIVSAGVSLILAVIVAWLAAFVINIVSIAILQGANRYKIKSVRKTIRQGLRFTARTTLAWTLILATMAVPIAIIAILSLAFIMLTQPGEYELISLAMVSTMAGIVSAGYVLVNYSLVPLVAIFEPQRSLAEAFFRARYLVSRRGRTFVIVMYLLLMTACAGVFGIAVWLHDLFGISVGLIATSGIIASIILFQAIMVSFYRKRRLARTR